MVRFLVLLSSFAWVSACVVTAPAKGLWAGAKFAGSTVYHTGKGVYQVGRITVKVADGVLDGTQKTLNLAITTVNAAGSAVRTVRTIQATALEAELAALSRARNVVEVVITPGG